MVYIFTEPKVTMDVDIIAERSMQMIGFLFWIMLVIQVNKIVYV